MLMDKRNQFATAAALDLGAPGTHLLGDVIDTEVARNLGEGKPLYLVIIVETTVTSGGLATVDFQLVSDAAAAIATDGTASVHASTGAIAVANLAAKDKFYLVVPLEGTTPYEKFLGVLYTVAGFALTAGKVHAFLTVEPPTWKAYDSPSMDV